MHAVAFRPLKDVTEPIRSLDIPMVEEFGQAGQQDGAGGRFRSDAHNQIQDRTGNHTIGENLKRMLVKAGDDFDALRTVVKLMEPPPKKGRFVPPTMPPIVNKRDDEIPDERAAD